MLAHRAAWKVKNITECRGSLLVEEKIRWTIKALISIRFDRFEQYHRAARAFPAIGHLGNKWNLFGDEHILNIRRLLREAVDSNAEERARAAAAATDLPEYARSAQAASLSRWVASWSPKRRRVGLQAVRLGADVCDDPNLAADKLCAYWGEVFSVACIDEEKAHDFLRDHAVPFPQPATWILTFDEFCKYISKTHNSAPGPDGICYEVWKIAPDPVRRTLYDCYTAWITGNPLPDNFNIAWLWLLPKGDQPEDNSKVIREPADTRPLSGSNTCAKILAGFSDTRLTR